MDSAVKPHVVFAVYNPGGGSVMDATRRQACHLVEQGYRVTVVANTAPVGWDGVEYQVAETPDNLFWKQCEKNANRIFSRLPHFCNRWDLRKFIPQYRFSHSAVRVIKKLDSIHKIDGIVSCQHFCAPGLVEIQNRKGIPFILVAHGDIFSHPRSSFPTALRLLYRKTAITAYRNASHVIVVGSELANRAIECGAASERVSVIPNGICSKDLGEQALKEEPEAPPFRLVFVGRLAPEKAVHLLIESLASPSLSTIHLQVVGDGPCRNDLELLVIKNNLTDRVTFSGAVKRDALGAIYNRCHLIVLPSLTEAQPVVTLEALVMGKPIVATQVGGIPDIVRHNWNGILVPPDDVDCLVKAISQIATDNALRKIMSENALSLAPKYKWDKVLHQFQEIIEMTFGLDKLNHER